MTDEQRKRIHDIEYSCDSRAELAERIVRLEDERNHWHVEQTHAYGNWEDACKRAKELESENERLREVVTAWQTKQQAR
jgi:DNA repair exonuclease SbcCD ATPase subunit